MNSSVKLDTVTKDADANASTSYATLPESDRTNIEAAALSGAVQYLPVAVQAAFRRKVFAIFALQLLFVTGVVAAIRWTPGLQGPWADSLNDSKVVIALPAGVMLVLLLALYKVRAKLPWNWLLLALFSVALGVVYSGVDILLDTTACVVYCGATFMWAVLMTVLSGVVLRQSARRHQDELLSPFLAGISSFVVVAAGVCALYGIVGDDFISSLALFFTLVVELVATLWFAHDAGKQLQVLTPDEYMAGTIYFHVDILSVLMIGVFGGVGGGAWGSAGYVTATTAAAASSTVRSDRV